MVTLLTSEALASLNIRRKQHPLRRMMEPRPPMKTHADQARVLPPKAAGAVEVAEEVEEGVVGKEEGEEVERTATHRVVVRRATQVLLGALTCPRSLPPPHQPPTSRRGMLTRSRQHPLN